MTGTAYARGGRAVARGLRHVRWYLRELTGEARWDDYLRHCAEHGHTPMSRRDFERARADAVERNPISRCC
ncbi:YbdD/YjiX family protein [Blastococcus deserti]|uniref:YbdD/YjiX family protein n=1 Tax=Blastococcus deserti TaxID=2259033 RepID=A0ABW4XDM9_9ACTN